MSRSLTFGLSLAALAAVAGCAPDYSPNTYNANAVQQANKVESAVVVGFRQVSISAAGTVGAVTGGAAGGILGAQVGPTDTASALGAVGGGIVGSLLGTGIEHATADTTGWEYIVRKSNGDLLSVTQREPQPIPLGQKVLVITGNQARIIPDYSVGPPPGEKDKANDKDKPAEREKPPEKPAPADDKPVPLAEPAAPTSSVEKAPLPPPDETHAPADDTPPHEPTTPPPPGPPAHPEPLPPAPDAEL